MVDVESVQNSVTNYSSGSSYNYYYGAVQGYSQGASYYSATNYTVNYWVRYALVSGKYNRFWSAGYTASTSYSVSPTWSIVYWFSTFGQTTYYTYASGTSYAYNEYLKIRQSVSSTVSTITSALISTAQSIGSLKVWTSGNQITARAFSDTNFVTQIGSDLVYTATGATITTQYGIGVSPSAYNQSAIIGTSVDISRN